MSTLRNALVILSELALKSAHTPAEELAVYDALAIAGKEDEFGEAAARIAHSRREADKALREFQAQQQEFSSLIGQ